MSSPGKFDKSPKKGNNRTRRMILRIVVIVLVSLFLGSSVYSLNVRSLVGNQLPMPLGVGAAVVLSDSMAPSLRVNDLVLVRPADSYAVGDVVVFQSGRILVIHRVIELGEGTLRTQGDANNEADEPILLSDVKGKMILHIPLIGAVIRFLKTLPGILLVCLLAGWLMHLSWQKEKDASNREMDAIKEEIRRLKDGLTQQPAAGENPPGDTGEDPRAPDA